jgi:hypothetical protein
MIRDGRIAQGTHAEPCDGGGTARCQDAEPPRALIAAFRA